jgi:hypothetical protein
MLAAAATAAVVAPATSSAATSKLCKLVPTRQIGQPIDATDLRIRSLKTHGLTASGAQGDFTLCYFSTRGREVAELSVIKMPSGRAARRELGVQINQRRTTRGDAAVRLRGPWRSAYRFGRDEVYMLKGGRIFHMTYYPMSAKAQRRLSKGLMRRFAVWAAAKL